MIRFCMLLSILGTIEAQHGFGGPLILGRPILPPPLGHIQPPPSSSVNPEELLKIDTGAIPLEKSATSEADQVSFGQPSFLNTFLGFPDLNDPPGSHVFTLGTAAKKTALTDVLGISSLETTSSDLLGEPDLQGLVHNVPSVLPAPQFVSPTLVPAAPHVLSPSVVFPSIQPSVAGLQLEPQEVTVTDMIMKELKKLTQLEQFEILKQTRNFKIIEGRQNNQQAALQQASSIDQFIESPFIESSAIPNFLIRALPEQQLPGSLEQPLKVNQFLLSDLQQPTVPQHSLDMRLVPSVQLASKPRGNDLIPDTQRTCSRLPFRTVCPDGRATQYTLRWYLSVDGRCSIYPWGYCDGDAVRTEPGMRTRSDCERLCQGRPRLA